MQCKKKDFLSLQKLIYLKRKLSKLSSYILKSMKHKKKKT